MLKALMALATLFACLSLHANPEPLGIKINKDTLSEVKNKYKVISTREAEVSGYFVSKIDHSKIDMPTLSSVQVETNKDKVVEAVSLTLDKSKFDEMYNALASKYTLAGSEIPFVGDKIAIFEDGESQIIVIANHMSFRMSVLYITKKYRQALIEANHAKTQAKEQRTQELL